jgi:hypothetical protein
MAHQSLPTPFAVGMLAPWKEETNDSNIPAIPPAYILHLPQELLGRIFSKLSQGDYKSLRVTCAKFEDILNPIVFRRLHLSKAKKDRAAFWSVTGTPKLAAHVKELVWFELAEDDTVFFETAMDPMPRLPHDALQISIEHDNTFTLTELANMASTLFWLPSAPKHGEQLEHMIQAERTRVLNEWFPPFYRALESMPKLDTFTSRPMPAHHVLSWPDSEYQFVAYLFQMDIRSNIQSYQRNDGFFSILLPAMARLGRTIKHLHWADEAYGNSSSAMRLRYSHRLSFKDLTSIDLCLCLPPNPGLPVPWNSRQWGKRITCWSILGECIHRVRTLSDISLCFEMADPKVGVSALVDALDEVLFDEKVRLPGLTRLSLRDGPGKRFTLLDTPLGKFLVRYGPQLRHLSFQRWPVYGNLLYQLWSGKQCNLDGIKIDNGDFETGEDIRESDLLAFLNRETNNWPLPIENNVRSTIGTNDESMETPGVCRWANPKFADIPEGMDFCAALMGEAAPSDGEDDEDDEFEPSESTDTSDSDSDFDMDSEDFDMDSEFDADDDMEPETESGSNNDSSEEAGTGQEEIDMLYE